MDLKKFAVRASVVLAIFVALCMFFSGTIRTLTTPKVRITKAKKGKLEERLDITGKLTFPEYENIKQELPEDCALTIDKVDTRVGYEVDEGDVLIVAHVTGYDQKLREAQKNYDDAMGKQIALEKRSRSVRVTRRDQAYADAYYGLRDARRHTATLRIEMDNLLKAEGRELTEEGYPKKASKELKAAIDGWREAVDLEAEAQKSFDANARYTVDEDAWTYITEKHDCQEKVDEASEALQKLVAAQETAQAITAPHDGYIAAVEVKAGDSYDGSGTLYAITPKKGKPVLRADISSLNRTVKKGAEAIMETNGGESLSSKVVEQAIDDEGKPYVDVEISKAMIRAQGNLYSMNQKEIPLTLDVKAADSTILVPVSAVRGSGKERFVYVIETEETSSGAKNMKLKKMTVKVLAESNDTASLETDITGYEVAYMEDRSLSDGAFVMTYLN